MMTIKRTGTQEIEEIETNDSRRGDNPMKDKRKKKAVNPASQNQKKQDITQAKDLESTSECREATPREGAYGRGKRDNDELRLGEQGKPKKECQEKRGTNMTNEESQEPGNQKWGTKENERSNNVLGWNT